MNEKQSLLAQGKLLEPKLDVVFHALFREDNKDLLGALTSEILREEVKIKTTDKEAEKEAEEYAKKYNITKEEFIKQIGNLDVLKYELNMRKAIDVMKGSK